MANLDPIPDGLVDLDLENRLEAFELAASEDPETDLNRFLPAVTQANFPHVLQELIRVDMELASARGEIRGLNYYQDRHPQWLGALSIRQVLMEEERRLRGQLANDESSLRQRNVSLAAGNQGSDLDSSSRILKQSTRRIPLRDVPGSADHDSNGTSDAPSSRSEENVLPANLEVVKELGKGTFGKVWLAREKALANRLVAVKVTSWMHGESQTLARLQHANIVPIFSMHHAGPYHVLVMPFLGQTTLASLLEQFQKEPSRPASGRFVVSTLMADSGDTFRDSRSSMEPVLAPSSQISEAASSPRRMPAGFSRSTLSLLEKSSFTEAGLWIMAELANGLAHAHDRGILHRDLKPANILLTEDGVPMLLDFNLAGDMSRIGDSREICGTIRYMAPEQLRAMALQQGVFSVQSDIYALGLILHELLVGALPFKDVRGSFREAVIAMAADREKGMDPTSRLPRDIRPAIRSILHKCLAPRPEDRYCSALHLREDLQRQLTDQPLLHAPDPSLRERLGKWCRRHPRLSSASSVAVLASCLLLLLLAGFLYRLRHLERLEAWQAREDIRKTRDHLMAAGLVGSTPRSELEEAWDQISRAVSPYRLESPGWSASPLLVRLSELDQKQLRVEMAELLFRGAEIASHLKKRPPEKEETQEWKDLAIRCNQQAQELFPGPVPRTFAMQQARLRSESPLPSRPLPATAPHDVVSMPAVDLLELGRYEEAASALREEVVQGPPRYGIWMGLAAAEWKRQRLGQAINALSAASALSPDSPWPFYHRGIARMELLQFEEAREDLDRFLSARQRDPDGYLNRAICRLQRKDARGAIDDVDRALACGSRRTRIYAIRAQAKILLGDPDGALQDKRQVLTLTPTDAESWCVRGEVRLQLHPDQTRQSLEDFNRSLASNPDYMPALRNKASLLSENLNQPAQAIEVMDHLLELRPDSLEDRVGKVVLLARMGSRDAARGQLAHCDLEAASALNLYQVASAYFLLNETRDDHRNGMNCLRLALKKDPTWAHHMLSDPDLKTVHNEPLFLELVKAGELLSGKR